VQEDHANRPALSFLSEEDKRRIHQAALQILRQTGLGVLHEEALALLNGAGCLIGEQNIVQIPEVLVEKAIQSAPHEIHVYDRDGRLSMNLGGYRSYFGTGSDLLYTIDVNTQQRRRCMFEDVRLASKLCDALPNIDFIMSMGIPHDVPIPDIYLYAFAEMVSNSNKPIVFTADTPDDVDDIVEMARHIAGGQDRLQESPFLLHYVEPISPLLFPESAVQKMLRCAEHRIPVGMIPAANAGGGAPITQAGAVALANAECLAGLVIHQLKNPGAPFLYGYNSSTLDMRSGVVSYGAPEYRLTDTILADMARCYRLPCWGTAGCTDSKVVDAQAGLEAMFSIHNAMLSRNNLVHDVGYIEYGSTSSMEMIILVDEIIDMCRRFMESVPINERTLALEAIGRAKVTRGFVDDDHTYENWREAQYQPKRLDRMQYDVWESSGRLDLYDRLNEEAKTIMATHVPEPKPPEVVQKIEEILERRKD